MEKTDVGNARIEAFFVQDQKLHSDDLELRFVDGVRIEKVLKLPFLVPDVPLHPLSDGIASERVGIEKGDLSFGKSERAVEFPLEIAVLLFRKLRIRIGRFGVPGRRGGRLPAEQRGAGEKSDCRGEEKSADPKWRGIFFHGHSLVA